MFKISGAGVSGELDELAAQDSQIFIRTNPQQVSLQYCY